MESEAFDEGICAIAKKLCMGNHFLFEELRSEMHIAISEMEPGRDKGYYFRAAKNAAIDFIRSKKNNYSYDNKIKHLSLDLFLASGFQIDTDGKIYAPSGTGHAPLSYLSTPWNLWDEEEAQKVHKKGTHLDMGSRQID